MTDSLTLVAKAARRLQEAEDAHREALLAEARAMLAANASGATWEQIADCAGLRSAKTARSRAVRAEDSDSLSPSVRWRHEHGHAPRPRRELPPGVNVSEAARRLGVTRATIYAWVRKGKLTAATDEAGRTRILLDDTAHAGRERPTS